MSLDEPNMSSIVGMLDLMLGKSRGFELDSNKKLVKPIKVDARITKSPQVDISVSKEEIPNTNEPKPSGTNFSDINLNGGNKKELLTPLKDEKKKGVGKFWTKISEWF